MVKKLHNAHVYLTETKDHLRSSKIHIGSSGKGDGALVDSVLVLVYDKEGSDANSGSYRDSAPHHLGG